MPALRHAGPGPGKHAPASAARAHWRSARLPGCARHACAARVSPIRESAWATRPIASMSSGSEAAARCRWATAPRTLPVARETLASRSSTGIGFGLAAQQRVERAGGLVPATLCYVRLRLGPELSARSVPDRQRPVALAWKKGCAVSFPGPGCRGSPRDLECRKRERAGVDERPAAKPGKARCLAIHASMNRDAPAALADTCGTCAR